MQDNVSSNPSFFSIRSFHFVEMTREISRLSLFLSSFFSFLITDLGVTQYRGQFTVTRTLHAFAPSVIIVLSTRDGTRISVGLGGEAHTSPFVNCLTCSIRLSHDRPWKIIRVRNIVEWPRYALVEIFYTLPIKTNAWVRCLDSCDFICKRKGESSDAESLISSFVRITNYWNIEILKVHLERAHGSLSPSIIVLSIIPSNRARSIDYRQN